jgi:hypothetical protein
VHIVKVKREQLLVNAVAAGEPTAGRAGIGRRPVCR